jgi:hypothetical protein
MILPQVHLRKPCYDFYFLQIIKFDQLWRSNRSTEIPQCSPPEISLNNSSVIATGGVYKDQGRNQYKLVTRTY